MKIGGFQKTTLLDFPGHVAATVFTVGCNFRCPFCHNADLLEGTQNLVTEEEVLMFLKKRQGILEGVCITGGEPTLQPDLKDFIRKVRALGYLIKLDTNGYRPEILKNLLEEKLLDYVAMDVKSGESGYGKAAGVEEPVLAKIRESIQILQEAGIPYEFRTTLVKGIHQPEDVEEIGRMIPGAANFFLQSYRDSEKVLCKGYEAFSREELQAMAEIARKYIASAALRGVE